MPREANHKLQRQIGLAMGFVLLNGIANAAQQEAYRSQGTTSNDTAQSENQQSVLVVDLKSLPDTIGIEHQDRINRFKRLAALAGILPPQVDDMQLAAGQVPGFGYPIPVVRLRFDERVFFDFDKDMIRAESMKVIDVMANNMRHDVPDVQLTILGHTDAIGGDDYNKELSRRRAASVMQALIERGINPAQMSTVAVGETQPIAPNSTGDGRARNRRVEFMISASELANLTLISKRRIISEFLVLNPGGKVLHAEAAHLTVLKPLTRAAPAAHAPLQLVPTGTVQGKRPIPQAQALKLAPLPDPKVIKLKEFHQAQLNQEFEL